jgi:predicted ATPase
MNRAATSVTITDPFVKYTSLITGGVYLPDAAQYRLAHHLQKVYLRLKDYTPAHEYQSRLQQIAKAVDATKSQAGIELASPSHPIRRNPLFARFFQKDEGKDSLALARVLTSYQAALHVDSPKGLFLSGEVGTGKSMLLDLLAEGLPTRHKKRWHFNTFMLHTFSRLEGFRKSRHLSADHPEYSLLWMAKELVETSPILFLDEFQLPDKAASKIMSNLFVAFFQLGGVLVASSNRMPEELERATGGYYLPPTTGGLVERVLGLGKGRYGGELFGQSSDFAAFLEVLKARCDFWHMEGTQDWRRRETQAVPSMEPDSSARYVLEVLSQAKGNPPSSADSGVEHPLEKAESNTQNPAKYFTPSDSEEDWAATTRHTTDPSLGSPEVHRRGWEQATLIVYGRQLVVPRQSNGVSYWDFTDLVTSLGPADYITLASNYHTFVIDHIPTLNVSMKNEARRFITLLDALYESRCKLIVRAEAGPDDLFFPDMRTRPATPNEIQPAVDRDDGIDATYSETIAEVYQDQMSPFRPNISTYSESPNSKYNPDQDSDFGTEQDRKIDFNKTGAFTGEDERFAYKRATSRLWELCSAQWHSRTGDWWQPLPKEARHWEGTEQTKPQASDPSTVKKSEITMGPSVELEETAGLERFKVARLRAGGQ